MIAQEKLRWPHAEALAVAEELVAVLAPQCERVMICGSLRRRKETVGDVEIVFVPRLIDVLRTAAAREDFFAALMPAAVDAAAVEIAELLLRGVIEKRRNVKDREMWGPKNKLARHVSTGIPVDLFAATPQNWWNYVVCRTGGAESNVRVAAAARQYGWKWNPYGEGFTRASGPDEGRIQPMGSEEEVFQFVKLPYLQPEERR